MKNMLIMTNGCCILAIGLLLVLLIIGIFKKNFKLRPKKNLKIIGILLILVLFISAGISTFL